jgi:chaperonin GroEL (HSP60 family)
MTVQNEWETLRLKADENIERHRKAEARLRFIALNGAGFDVIKGQVVDMRQAGIYDAASVVKAAAFSASHSAALALTVDVLVHGRNPPNASATT